MICPSCHQDHPEGSACPPLLDAVASESDPLIGTALGDYTLVRELGRGSDGRVYLAEHGATGLNVAIKLVPPHLVGDAALARRMAREARFTNQIALESVVNVFDLSEEGPLGSYLVMEQLQGETLADVARARLPADEALSLLIQVADALGEAHRRHIVHAALKPSNIFRVSSDTRLLAKLLPFGVHTGPLEPEEEAGDRAVAQLGSPDLRSPEQSLGAPPDPRMDVYSLGAIAYLLATGRVPFTAPTPQALERAHAEVVPVAPHRVNPRVSRGWSAAILRALEKSPDQRFQNGSELADAFRAAATAPDPVGSSTSMFVLEAPAAAPSPGLAAGFVVNDPAAAPPPVADDLVDQMVITTPLPTKSPVPPGAERAVVMSAPVPPKAPEPAPVDQMVVTTTPAPQRAPAVTTTPAPQKAPEPQPVDQMIVTTTPVPQRGPAVKATPAPQKTPVAAGIADGFVTTTAAPARAAPSPSPVAAPQPSAPNGMAEPAPSQGLALRAAITNERGELLGDFVCSSVTRAGLIVCSTGALPPLLSRVKLNFADLGGLSCDAQVVHHVSAEQAVQWKVSPGYGVQFGALTADQRARLEGAHQGLRPPETPSGLARRPDDPAAAEVLKRFSAERATDGYAMLAISKAAPFDAIRDRVRDVRRVLEGLSDKPLSLAQQKAFEEARARLDEMGKTLGNAMSRMEYDAERGNFEGVARCISAGLSVTEIEEARLRFLKTHSGIAGKSHGHILAGQSLEGRQQMPQALEAYGEALRIDPLNLTAQQRYWAVRRQLEKA